MVWRPLFLLSACAAKVAKFTPMDAKELTSLSYTIIGVAMRIHSQLGSGMMESVYETVLASELRKLGHHVQQQLAVPIQYAGFNFKKGFGLDLLVDEKIVVEIKSVSAVAPEHVKQVATYLGLMNLKLGLILNLGAPSMRYGIKRVINER